MKRTRRHINKVHVIRTGKHVIRAQVKRDKEKLQSRSKDRVLIFICILTSPGQ